MQTKIIYNLLRLCILIVILCHYSQGQQKEVSPKLDFDEADNKNDTVPIVPGVKKGRKDEDHDLERENESDGEKRGKSGPKIHGVRVTVDTGDTHKSKESKESVEITDLGKNKKRVGIHTDITFEITAEGDEHTNKTSREQDVDKEDASVPIYKGRGGSNHKTRKPYDPKTHWNPNFSTERRYDHSGRGNYPDYYPEYYPNNVPVYIGSADARGAGSPIYRQSDGWNSYIPRWTTERSMYVDAYNKPNDVSAYRNNAWKPCYCLTNSNEYRRRRDNHPHYHYPTQSAVNVVKPTSSLIKIVDGKLESTFSRK
ncbi:uncharacterized protein LOC119602184 [Lucilia sericata]|uniref:uncharacterized protein LOC119602184 n=1 Tax=Lucilia sericata TaxID=13632 RepID=UPI0018A84939|nr:uncharacterized protein LOC119602184 [Lucilia sericata]